jgi:hypothetical protein
MTKMLASTNHSGMRFNSEFFDQADIEKLLSMRPPHISEAYRELSLSPVFETPAFKKGDIKALYDPDAIQTSFKKALDVLMADPDFAKAIEEGGKEKLMAEAKDNMASQLQNSSISEEVANNNKAVRESLQLVTDANGVIGLEVEGTRLLEVDPTVEGATILDKIMQIAWVVLDIFSLICTVIGIAIMRGADWAKRIVNFLKNIQQSVLDWAGKFKEYLGNLISKLSGAGPSSSEWVAKVKSAAKEIASAFIAIVKYGWDTKVIYQLVGNCLKTLLDVPWYKKVYYALQVVASIVLMAASGGASIVLKIVLAVIQLALFIWDTITLVLMFEGKLVDRRVLYNDSQT